jgi:hypothetical protein
MSLVRRINEPGKGCGVMLTESMMRNPLYCGKKSKLPYEGQDKYHMCEDCFRVYMLSRDVRAK